MTTEELLTQVEKYEKLLPPDPPPGDHRMQVLYDMVKTVRNQTENYTKPEKISTVSIDVRPILQRENVDPSQWLKIKQSFQRNEHEAVEWLVSEMRSEVESKEKPGKEEKDKARAKAVAMAMFLFKSASLKL